MIAQLPDRIIYHMEYFDLYTNPLESFWIRMRKKRPAFCTRDNCKRGYVATWEIREDQLFLLDVDATTNKWSLFSGKKVVKWSPKAILGKGKSGVKAFWYSGKLRIPVGAMTLFENKDYESRFEKEVIITVEAGEVTKVVTLDNIHRTLVVH